MTRRFWLLLNQLMTCSLSVWSGMAVVAAAAVNGVCRETGFTTEVGSCVAAASGYERKKVAAGSSTIANIESTPAR
jgi:hypothetical protein